LDRQAPEVDPLDSLPPEAKPFAGHLAMLVRISRAKAGDLPNLFLELAADKEASYALSWALLDLWVALDPEAGFAFVTTAPSPPLTAPARTSLVWQYLGRWALRDPDTAVSQMMSLPAQRDRGVAVSRISQYLSEHRPADFFRLLPQLSEVEGRETNYFLKQAAASFAALDPAAAMEALAKVTEAQRLGTLAGLADGWAQRDSAAAVAWARGLEVESERSLSLHAIANQLILSDPQRAAELCREGTMESDPGASTAQSGLSLRLQDIAMKLAARDPMEAVAWLREYFPEQAKSGLGALLAAQDLPQNASAVVERLAQVPDLVFTDGVPSSWLSQWNGIPDHIPAGLAKAAQIEDASVRSGVLAALLGFQARTEPEEAIRAMGSHSLGEASAAYVLEKALRSWAGTDLTAASAWLAAQPPGTERDGAIQGFNEVARVAEPSSALQWAMTISEPQQREQAVLRTLQSWRTIDPSAAAGALDRLVLPEEKKAALAKQLFPTSP
jgi:hypothetical protein